VVGYVWRPWGIHIDIVRNRGSKGIDGCPLATMTLIFMSIILRLRRITVSLWPWFIQSILTISSVL
jgi:hypothetical protein